MPLITRPKNLVLHINDKQIFFAHCPCSRRGGRTDRRDLCRTDWWRGDRRWSRRHDGESPWPDGREEFEDVRHMWGSALSMQVRNNCHGKEQDRAWPVKLLNCLQFQQETFDWSCYRALSTLLRFLTILVTLQTSPRTSLRGWHSLPRRVPGPGQRGGGADHLHGEGAGQQVPGGDWQWAGPARHPGLGPALGPGHTRAQERREAEEDRVHQDTHRVWTDAIRDSDGWHPI